MVDFLWIKTVVIGRKKARKTVKKEKKCLPSQKQNDMSKFIAVIPARFASSRFPGKPLAQLGGKRVIERVYEEVSKALDEVWVATDDRRIYGAVEGFGGKVVMTRSDHKSGTDRIAEAISIINSDCDVVVNVQGDEPFIDRSQIETVCRCFDDPHTQIATIGKYFSTMDEVNNPNSPKIILDNAGYALLFTRATVPFVRGVRPEQWLSHYPYLKHLGLYAYRTDVLRQITRLPMSTLEQVESLEQLRWLQNGYKIKVGITDVETIGIDTPDDLIRAEEFLKRFR